MISVQKIHHVAYRCKDAKETAKFYKDILNMDLLACIAEDRMPSLGDSKACVHIFLDAGMGNILAFCEVANEKETDGIVGTSSWPQHIAFELVDEEALLSAREELQAQGIEVLGLSDHTIIKSLYFFDPNGHRLELTCRSCTQKHMTNLKAIAPLMLNEWSRTKK